MLFSLRREYVQLISSGGQFILILIGLKINTREGWSVCLPLIALLSLVAWRSALNRLRAVRDTPTSRIASAAQGYVELIGRGARFADTPLLSRLRQLPCVWYRYQIEESYQRKESQSWRTLERGESSDSFLLRDATGACVVDPEHAEISTRYREHWQVGNLRYTEWTLLEQETIYVLGEFRTHNHATAFNSNRELNRLLAEWKRDMPALHRRFDINQDGELDMSEWMLARKAAQREVAKLSRHTQSKSDTHHLAQPRTGQLYLISNYSPLELSRRYFYLSWGHVIIFFATLATSTWML
jgi:hypothetical protein